MSLIPPRMAHARPQRLFSPRSALLSPLLTLLCVGCNEHPVVMLNDQSFTVAEVGVSLEGREKMDLLWVIDNSSSMCEEQKTLRANFSRFATLLGEGRLDFHIGVTTTHAPDPGTPSVEPLALRAHLQSRPQPVPGSSTPCLYTSSQSADQRSSYEPLRESLDAAFDCVRDDFDIGPYSTWNDEQIRCALLSPTQRQKEGCVASVGGVDLNGDGAFDRFDLFPPQEAYRELPLVLRAEDYRVNGVLDTVRLTRDFGCMAMVGTQGDGREKGLSAAVEALSPELTGGALGAPGVDESAPNHGFLRRDAKLAVIFISDENDCSHDGTFTDRDSRSCVDACAYENQRQLEGLPSSLISPERLAEQLRESVAASKHVAQIDDAALLVAGIYGTSKIEPPGTASSYPFTCDAGKQGPEIKPVCASSLGEAFSGDRYERFMRQFANHYPNQVVTRYGEEARLDFDQLEPLGWMCTDSFAQPLEELARRLSSDRECVVSHAGQCTTDEECGPRPHEEGEGRCLHPDQGDATGVCADSMLLMLDQGGDGPAIEEVADDYCVSGSLTRLAGRPASCVVRYDLYALSPCVSGAGLWFSWHDQALATQMAQRLPGFRLNMVYRR